MTTELGPSDTQEMGVVWAISEFDLFLRVFLTNWIYLRVFRRELLLTTAQTMRKWHCLGGFEACRSQLLSDC